MALDQKENRGHIAVAITPGRTRALGSLPVPHRKDFPNPAVIVLPPCPPLASTTTAPSLFCIWTGDGDSGDLAHLGPCMRGCPGPELTKRRLQWVPSF